MWSIIADVLFALLAFLIVYHHLLYPLLLKKLSRRKHSPAPDIPQRQYREQAEDSDLPDITLIIPAYNEAASIADKIRNLASQDYPSAHFNVEILCDGCTDNTADLARLAHAEPECRWLPLTVRAFSSNRGKIAVINEAIQRVQTPIVAFSDVSALLPVDTLLTAAVHFQQPDIGVVGPGYRILNAGSQGESHYWQYQTQIKLSESALGSVLGMHGACYFIRGECLEPLPPDTINDDFILPMLAISKGYRAVYEPRCLSLELETSDSALESRRRRRIAAGNTQQLWRLRHLLNPRYRWDAFNFFSGKGLRVLMPFCLVGVFVISLLRAPHSLFFLLLLIAQLCGYLTIIMVNMTPRYAWPSIVKKVQYLVNGHWYNLIGACRYLAGKEKGRWSRAGEQGEK